MEANERTPQLVMLANKVVNDMGVGLDFNVNGIGVTDGELDLAMVQFLMHVLRDVRTVCYTGPRIYGVMSGLLMEQNLDTKELRHKGSVIIAGKLEAKIEEKVLLISASVIAQDRELVDRLKVLAKTDEGIDEIVALGQNRADIEEWLDARDRVNVPSFSFESRSEPLLHRTSRPTPSGLVRRAKRRR